MEAKPKRSLRRVDYRELADVKIPRTTSSKCVTGPRDDKLYRLRVLEEDNDSDRVKVRYIGYGSEHDEWRAKEDVVVLDDPDSSSSEEYDDIPVAKHSFKQFCLYDELGYRIKCCLMSDRKRDPLCRISMPFDTVYFDGLARRGTIFKGAKYYTIIKFSAFEDILGSRWFIRGLNSAGDFCYIKPKTVRFRLKEKTRRVDYQLKEDGTLTKHFVGVGNTLTFEFVRGDGTHSQWNSVLRACK